MGLAAFLRSRVWGLAVLHFRGHPDGSPLHFRGAPSLRHSCYLMAAQSSQPALPPRVAQSCCLRSACVRAPLAHVRAAGSALALFPHAGASACLPACLVCLFCRYCFAGSPQVGSPGRPASARVYFLQWAWGLPELPLACNPCFQVPWAVATGQAWDVLPVSQSVSQAWEFSTVVA